MTERPEGWDAVADIGRLGLETAATVVERLLAVSRNATDLRLPLLDATADSDTARKLRADAERLIDLYAEWTRQLADTALGLAVTATAGGTDVLVLGPVAPGQSASATAWLHAGLTGVDGTGAAGGVGARVTDLTAHDGALLRASAVSCEAAEPSSNGSLAITVTAKVPRRTKPGRYHGHLLAAGFPEVGLPVMVDVRVGEE